MTPFFSSDFVLNRKLYNEYSAGMDKQYRKVSKIYTLAFALFFLVLAFSYAQKSILATCITGIIAGCCLFAAFFGYLPTAAMRFERLSYVSGGEVRMHVAFFDERIVNDTQNIKGELNYSAVDWIFKTKNLIVLVHQNDKTGHQSVIINISTLTGGTPEELQAFLAKKCGNVRKRGIADFFSNAR